MEEVQEQQQQQQQRVEFKVLFRRRFPQYMAAVIACLGAFSLGCCIGWSGPSVELLKSVYNYNITSTNLIASAILLGAPIGLSLVPFLVDRIGRKWTMMSLAPIFGVGWICVTLGASKLYLIILGRTITGACGGMFCVISPMYCAEISEVAIRGTLGTFFQLLLVNGILFAYCTGFTKNMKMISFLCGLGPLFFGCSMLFMPESPLYYFMKNNEEAARKALRYFRGPDYDLEPDVKALKDQVQSSKKEISLALFMKKPVLKTMAIALGLMFAQQFSGVNVVIFYAETIFKLTGVKMDSLVQMVILGSVQVVACSCSTLLIDKVGRKPLMMISCGVMSICMGGIGFFFLQKKADSDAPSSLSWLPLTSTCLYIIAFCLGAGPIPWSYLSEIFPVRLKGTASAIVACANWIMAFTVTMTFSGLIDAVGIAFTFLIYSVNCGLCVLFVKLYVIETKGKSITQILQELGTYDVDDQ